MGRTECAPTNFISPNTRKVKKMPDRDIKNLDNEDTMLIPNTDSYEEPVQTAAPLPPLHKKKKVSRSQQSEQYSYPSQPYEQQNGQYYGNEQYYGNDQYYDGNGQYSSNAQYYGDTQYQGGGQYYGDMQYQGQQQAYNGGQYYNDAAYTPQQQEYYQQPRKSSPRKKATAPKKQKRRHKSLLGTIIKRIISVLLILFLLIFGIYSCTSLSLIRKLDHEETGPRQHYSDTLSASYVTSILVIGTDGRTADDRGRSDSMILISLNSKTNEIILTSFMRDSYVDIPDYGYNKLNASYAFGGPELLMDTIEYNYGVRIDDYVRVNFNSFASIIDSVGGLDLEISDEEAEEINVILISEVNELMGDDRMDDLLSGGGKVHLDGKQALSYARIRAVGNSDFERTERQRTVVTQLFDKITSFKPSVFSNIASNVIPDISTNMSTTKMYLLSLRLPFLIGYDTKQIQMPYEGTFYGDTVYIDGYESSVLNVDLDANYKILEDEIFSDK